MKIISKFAFLFFLLLSGCVSIQANIDYQISDLKKCKIIVNDDRPDKRIIYNYQVMEINPSLQDILTSKLCGNERIVKRLDINKIEVHIEDVKYDMITNLFSEERMFQIIGYLNTGKDIIKISSYAKVITSGGGIWKIMPPLIDKSMDDFVIKVAHNLGSLY